MSSSQKKYEFTLPVGTILTGGKYPYRIEKVLGQGNFGITYLSSTRIKIGTTAHEVYFAIKEFFSQEAKCYREEGNPNMLYPPPAKEEVLEDKKKFKEEARRLATICEQNENIVNVNEVFDANNTSYYVMEYLEGCSLKELCHQKTERCLGEEEALNTIKPIAKAVEYIHSEYRLLHLDIKPDNIMMLGDKPVLIDFGISLHFNKKGNLTSTNKSLLGSVGYAPIEQMTNQGITSFAPEADVYALGATLYYMLVGKDPISAFEVRPEFIEKELGNRGVSEKVCKAIIHAMQPKREDRTKYAYAFLKELEKGSESNKPKSNNPLPANYVLHLGNTDYLIIRVVETTDYYVKYQAVRYTGQQSGSNSNLTVKKTYNIYEYFTKSVHQRQEDNTVAVTSGVSSPKENFIALALKHKIQRDNTFETNGTLYFIEMPKPPVPPKPKWKWILVAGIIIISLGFNMSRFCNGKETDDFLNDEDTVSKIAVRKDSGTVTRQSSITEQNAKEQNQNPEMANPEKARLVESEMGTDLQKAINSNDLKILINYANKGEIKAIDALALYYINCEDDSANCASAQKWANKASPKVKKEVLHKLEIRAY